MFTAVSTCRRHHLEHFGETEERAEEDAAEVEAEEMVEVLREAGIEVPEVAVLPKTMERGTQCAEQMLEMAITKAIQEGQLPEQHMDQGRTKEPSL